MPIIEDPSKLTYLVQIPGGSIVVPPDVAQALNDVFRAFRALEKQTGYVLPRRLDRATFYRARYDDAVAV